MEYNHNIIFDLLPLYADGICSEESAAAVREHLAECAECRATLETLTTEPLPAIPNLDGAEVLRKAGQKVTASAVLNVAGIAVIVLYWIIYAVMKPLANVGDYRYFSYSVWEVWSLGFLLMPALTVVWLAAIIIKSAKQRSWRKRLAMLLILTVLLAGQIGIEFVRSQETSTVTVGWIDNVGEGSFIFNNGMSTKEISCSYEVTGLLKADGTMYVITYYSNRLSPGNGTLSTIEEAGYARAQTSWVDGGS